MTETKNVALISGANKGLGLETARQLAALGLRVLLGVRSQEKGDAALEAIQREGSDADIIQFDVTKPEEIGAAFERIADKFGRLDVLVNNAGVMLESTDPERAEVASVFNVSAKVVAKTFEINTLGPLRLAQAAVPLMKHHNYGRIVNVSSGMGQLAEMNGSWPGYRLSKTALNALTRILATECAGTNIKVNSVCPGWVRTDMGGPNATRSLSEGTETIVWAATLPDDGPSGGFFRDKTSIDW